MRVKAAVRGWKHCRKCGKDLALYMYYLKSDGNPDSDCKACHRDRLRERYRTIRLRPGFLEGENARRRRKYKADAEYRETVKARVRAHHHRMKQAHHIDRTTRVA